MGATSVLGSMGLCESRLSILSYRFLHDLVVALGLFPRPIGTTMQSFLQYKRFGKYVKRQQPDISSSSTSASSSNAGADGLALDSEPIHTHHHQMMILEILRRARRPLVRTRTLTSRFTHTTMPSMGPFIQRRLPKKSSSRVGASSPSARHPLQEDQTPWRERRRII